MFIMTCRSGVQFYVLIFQMGIHGYFCTHISIIFFHFVFLNFASKLIGVMVDKRSNLVLSRLALFYNK